MHVQWLKKQENISTKNFAAINMLVTQHNWMNCMNILKIIWKVYQSEPYYKRVLPGITWFSILLWKAGNSVAVYSVKCTWTWASEEEKNFFRRIGKFGKFVWRLLLLYYQE